MTTVLPLLRSVRLLADRLRAGELAGLDALAEAALDNAPPGRLLAVDAELRRRPATAELRGSGLGILGLLSMQRDGFVREAATLALRAYEGPLAFRLLLVRCNDVVSQVSAAAEDGLVPWLATARAAAIAEALPLIEALRATVRAGKSPILARLDMLLTSPSALVDTALRTAAEQSSDPETRRVAIAKLAARDLPRDARCELLAAGLRDPHPRVRLSSARLAVAKTTPAEVRDALLAVLEQNTAPTVRLLALKARRHADPTSAAEAITAATLDANANVRHHARRYLARLDRAHDTRAQALSHLADATATTGALVACLAALSDVGRKEDTAQVRRFAEHPVARVRHEAERTLKLLGALPS